ncbi:MAG: hypothetical protein WC538_20955 [Thermoanaerobaculia bacterium]|jgi:hypothetical protein
MLLRCGRSRQILFTHAELFVFEPGEEGYVVHDRADIPPELVHAIRRNVSTFAAVADCCAPTTVLTADEGPGSQYVPGTILLDSGEIWASAYHLLDHVPSRKIIFAAELRRRGRPPTSRELDWGAWRAAAIRIHGHEFGHHLLDASVLSTPYGDGEAGADWVAGFLDGWFARSETIGARLFYKIGCNEKKCSHPPSIVRRNAYEDGWSSGALARIQTVRKAA